MHQTRVTVSFVKESRGDCCDERAYDPGRFVPDQDRITIEVGDMVMWNSPDASSRPYAVHGAKDFFSSTSLTNECGYTHVFTSPGDHEYADANGSGLRGVVHVADPKPRNQDELRAWRARFGKGTLVMISDAQPEPAEVEITMGQTVFFAVVKGPGVTISDPTLIPEVQTHASAATA